MPDAARRRLIDAYSPDEMARRILEVGAGKARLPASSTLALATLAGAFIAVGAAFATLAMTGAKLGVGPTRVLGGVTFSLGLILVVVAGAELFTGNNLVAMAWASRLISTRGLLRNWALVFAGNFAGAVLTAALVFWSGTWSVGGDGVAMTAMSIGAAKAQLGFGEAFARGILCNALVCLAVWLCLSGRTTTDRILAIIFPITAFVALGFEHSIANMYFIPYAIMLRSNPGLAASAEGAGIPVEALTAAGLRDNLIPVTLGNIVGGTLLVAAIYWFVYLRGQATETT
jgi:formate/nitrite transporter